MRDEYEQAYSRLEERHPWFVARRELFSTLARRLVDRDATILDFGCGTGMFLSHLQELGFTDLSGVEPSASLRRQFRLPSEAVLASLPESGSYELIFLLDVLEHVEHDVELLASLEALLEPGGRLLFSVPAHPFLWSRHDERNQHYRRYRRAELRRKLESAGFSIQRLSYWNATLFVPIWMLRKFRPRPTEHDPELSMGPLSGIATAILRIENFLVRRLALPWGVSLVGVASTEKA